MIKITRKLLDEFESVLYNDPYHIDKWNREHPESTWMKIKETILELVGEPKIEPLSKSILTQIYEFSEPNKKHD